ncbi:MAG: single-stranded DNA-binding protein [Clostridia bacterium]|nr:single-stranded DNA-binding protein [Clostridia bacterium]MBO7289204.1 single-stranded DNA-binding protein [Clostridia bacterium]
MDNVNLNNEVKLTGLVDSELKVSHEIYGEAFYSFVLRVMRLSDICDYINVTVSERLLSSLELKKGSFVTVNGQFRSYNNYSDTGSRLILTVFARDIVISDEFSQEASGTNPNYIYLNGFLCKMPVYRTTPFGREITDILIAVNRAYNKSDYIPCIAWGRNARFSSNLSVGDNIKIWGRIQSREYQKKISENETITKTAYEISISKMEVSGGINEEEQSEEIIS